ncbi:MAG: monomethylamine:corrinoid methyltransferase [Desulfobacterales bacterium]|jgi:methylamine--corrinoid protein Co-methyltransferase
MGNILDICEKALNGPIMKEEDFDKNRFMPAALQLAKDIDIKFDRENPVPHDDTAADRIFDAAKELVEETGVYCLSTARVMQFSRQEIEAAISSAPGQVRAGEGNDAKVFGMRKPDEPKWPWFQVGSGIVSSEVQYAANIVEGYASIPEVNSIQIPSLSRIRGIPVSAGAPTEFYAGILGLRTALDALKRAGRPGLPIFNLHPTTAVAVTNIAASAPQFGSRLTDAWLCGMIAEMKVSYDTLNKVAYLHSSGANVAAESGPMLGGYAGGPEGFAILCTAYLIAGQLVHKCHLQLNFPIHFMHSCSSGRDVLWGVSLAIQASSRNIAVPVLWGPYCAAGPNTKMYMYEAAAIYLAWVTSGAPCVNQPHPAKAVKVDGITPLEAKFCVELGKAASKLTRAQANDLVIRILEKYESRITSPPEGDRYQDCHDPVTSKPNDAYVKLYSGVIEELAADGIPF